MATTLNAAQTIMRVEVAIPNLQSARANNLAETKPIYTLPNKERYAQTEQNIIQIWRNQKWPLKFSRNRNLKKIKYRRKSLLIRVTLLVGTWNHGHLPDLIYWAANKLASQVQDSWAELTRGRRMFLQVLVEYLVNEISVDVSNER